MVYLSLDVRARQHRCDCFDLRDSKLDLSRSVFPIRTQTSIGPQDLHVINVDAVETRGGELSHHNLFACIALHRRDGGRDAEDDPRSTSAYICIQLGGVSS